MSTSLACVVTTIQKPTACMRTLSDALIPLGAEIIAMGDKKGPESFELQGARFVSLADQLELPFSLVALLPTGHYVRKNLGYLIAIKNGAECIYETDDDNAPNKEWKPRNETTDAQTWNGHRWCNAFRLFSKELIWPRGFPLSQITNAETYAPSSAPIMQVHAPIQQGLADLAPDIDAIWRLTLQKDFYFEKGDSVHLPQGTWCPFNSQSTWWWPVAYPLMYLPSFCTFRMTDIWRSFIAQRCVWELGHGLVIHGPEVVQERNLHNLIRDFEDEVPGYTGNEKMISVLEALVLQKGTENIGANMRACYVALIEAGFFPEKELALVDAWLNDLKKMNHE